VRPVPAKYTATDIATIASTSNAAMSDTEGRGGTHRSYCLSVDAFG
jgi:hypothetical protein